MGAEPPPLGKIKKFKPPPGQIPEYAPGCLVCIVQRLRFSGFQPIPSFFFLYSPLNLQKNDILPKHNLDKTLQ